jgi:tetratricopeptide (TPR) repeat protein
MIPSWRLAGPWLALWLVGAHPPDDALQRADAAWTAGRFADAAAAYDSVLHADPGSVRALHRIGIWLSWENRLDSALVMIRRARAIEPDDADLGVAEARVLSWAGRLGAAVALYDSILKTEPDDREARLGRAQSLGWAGRFAASDSAYAEMMRAHPDDPEALGGRAQVASWWGYPNRAEALYAYALDRDPKNLDALVGLARLHHQQGRERSAARRLELALALDPRSPAARQLAQEVRAARRPQLETAVRLSRDSDENLVWTRVLSSSASLADGVRGFASMRSTLASDPARDASGAGGEAGIDYVRDRFQITAAGGGRRLSFPGAPDWSVTSGRAALSSRLWRSTVFGIGLGRHPFDDNAQLIGSRIEVEELEGSFESGLPAGLSLSGTIGRAWLSDGNLRRFGSAGLVRQFHPGWTAGAALRVTGYDRRGTGYFSPDRFALGEARTSLALGQRAWRSVTRTGLGAQQVGRGAASQLEWHAEQSLIRRWGAINQVELSIGASNSANSSSTGAYSSFESGLVVRIGL